MGNCEDGAVFGTGCGNVTVCAKGLVLDRKTCMHTHMCAHTHADSMDELGT